MDTIAIITFIVMFELGNIIRRIIFCLRMIQSRLHKVLF